MESINSFFAEFSEQQQQQFTQLLPLYKHWNEQINVISRKDIDALYTRHVLHSLAIAAIISFEKEAKVLDIGTGGGFPGIPLAIMFPEVHFTLVDSIGKKIKVVNEVSEAIGLKNITAIHSRVENLAPQKFHYAVSRAVAPLADLWQWVRPFIQKGRQTDSHANGLFCLKGGDLTQEISASGLRPHVWSLEGIFPGANFEDKQVLYVPYR